ncbi:hypothetical protein TRFO_39565 [Tritrichomonas foetus]|uniref:Uncharacterized protein n=1 Tax=Tritrichomonas foetus TaxID=1144522 RepID=A0A1J4J9Y3_9EUKA|nr:hypothetical protein TRFO_39565 [Tritrichomonas foetus]|eukprot:OHS94253.1 hypothetical protein TRFO_39565 [Tritrichomonas foetus]
MTLTKLFLSKSFQDPKTNSNFSTMDNRFYENRYPSRKALHVMTAKNQDWIQENPEMLKTISICILHYFMENFQLALPEFDFMQLFTAVFNGQFNEEEKNMYSSHIFSDFASYLVFVPNDSPIIPDVISLFIQKQESIDVLDHYFILCFIICLLKKQKLPITINYRDVCLINDKNSRILLNILKNSDSSISLKVFALSYLVPSIVYHFDKAKNVKKSFLYLPDPSTIFSKYECFSDDALLYASFILQYSHSFLNQISAQNPTANQQPSNQNLSHQTLSCETVNFEHELNVLLQHSLLSKGSFFRSLFLAINHPEYDQNFQTFIKIFNRPSMITKHLYLFNYSQSFFNILPYLQKISLPDATKWTHEDINFYKFLPFIHQVNEISGLGISLFENEIETLNYLMIFFACLKEKVIKNHQDIIWENFYTCFEMINEIILNKKHHISLDCLPFCLITIRFLYKFILDLKPNKLKGLLLVNNSSQIDQKDLLLNTFQIIDYLIVVNSTFYNRNFEDPPFLNFLIEDSFKSVFDFIKSQENYFTQNISTLCQQENIKNQSLLLIVSQLVKPSKITQKFLFEAILYNFIIDVPGYYISINLLKHIDVNQDSVSMISLAIYRILETNIKVYIVIKSILLLTEFCKLPNFGHLFYETQYFNSIMNKIKEYFKEPTVFCAFFYLFNELIDCFPKAGLVFENMQPLLDIFSNFNENEVNTLLKVVKKEAILSKSPVLPYKIVFPMKNVSQEMIEFRSFCKTHYGFDVFDGNVVFKKRNVKKVTFLGFHILPYMKLISK